MKNNAQHPHPPARDKYTLIPAETAAKVPHILCPRCVETLTRNDIEQFMRCPYCNYKFQITPEFEVFMLQHLAAEWERMITPKTAPAAEPEI